MNEVCSIDRDVPLPPMSFGPVAGPRLVPSAEILQGDREILIQHRDQTYRLRVTRANKLILNK